MAVGVYQGLLRLGINGLHRNDGVITQKSEMSVKRLLSISSTTRNSQAEGQRGSPLSSAAFFLPSVAVFLSIAWVLPSYAFKYGAWWDWKRRCSVLFIHGMIGGSARPAGSRLFLYAIVIPIMTQSKIPQSLWFHAVCSRLLNPNSFKSWYLFNLLYL